MLDRGGAGPVWGTLGRAVSAPGEPRAPRADRGSAVPAARERPAPRRSEVRSVTNPRTSGWSTLAICPAPSRPPRSRWTQDAIVKVDRSKHISRTMCCPKRFLSHIRHSGPCWRTVAPRCRPNYRSFPDTCAPATRVRLPGRGPGPSGERRGSFVALNCGYTCPTSHACERHYRPVCGPLRTTRLPWACCWSPRTWFW